MNVFRYCYCLWCVNIKKDSLIINYVDEKGLIERDTINDDTTVDGLNTWNFILLIELQLDLLIVWFVRILFSLLCVPNK